MTTGYNAQLRFVEVNWRRRLTTLQWGYLTDWFGMHMAFDADDSAKLEDAVDNYGWSVVQELYPAEYLVMDTEDQALTLCVEQSTHYKSNLLACLAANWLVG